MGDIKAKRTLIVPDVHERMSQLTRILSQHLDQASRVVFLGDWFDTFAPYNIDRITAVCKFIVDSAEVLRDMSGRGVPVTHLLGNHDCHYAFADQKFQCSGYAARTKMAVDALIPVDVWRKFHVFTKVGPYTVSHAGFCEHTLQYARPEIEREAIETALAGGFDLIFGAGHARGGWLPFGGPTWLDWDYEFSHIPDVPQIVGHTPHRKVQSKGEKGQLQSWDLDTHSKHIAWVDEETGAVEVEAV